MDPEPFEVSAARIKFGNASWEGFPKQMITDHDIENWFTYHAPKGDQPERYVAIRDGAKAFANIILANTKSSAEQTVVIRKIREAVMTANASIACED